MKGERRELNKGTKSCEIKEGSRVVFVAFDWSSRCEPWNDITTREMKKNRERERSPSLCLERFSSLSVTVCSRDEKTA